MNLNDMVQIHFLSVCHDCKQRHEIKANYSNWLNHMSEWEVKHRGHKIDFYSPERKINKRLKDQTLYKMLDAFKQLPWWFGDRGPQNVVSYAPNADIKIAYAASAAYTIGLQATPLASSATFVLGRESTAIDNTTNKYLDYLVGGKATTGTSPTAAKTIRIWTHANLDDTPTYADVLDGTDSDETFTSTDFLNAITLLSVLGTDNTSNRTYFMQPKSIALAFGGVVPKFHGLYISHDTGVALNATGSNHVWSYTGIYSTSV